MKTRLAALAAALLMTLPHAAHAQFMDLNTIIAGIGGTEFLKDAERVDTSPGLRVVRLSTLMGADRYAARLQAAVEMKERDIRYLQGNLIINPIAVTAIRNAGVTLEQIVSLDIAGDNNGVLYANDLQ